MPKANDQTYKELNKLINNSKNILITWLSDDGDVYGSIYALYHILKKLDKNIYIYSNSNIDKYAFIPNNIYTISYIDDLPIDLIISIGNKNTLDTKNIKQIYIWTQLVWDSNISIVDNSAISIVEIIWDIIKNLWYDKIIDSHISTLLLLSATIATNSFYNSNITPNILQTTSEIASYWWDHKLIIQNLYKSISHNKLKLHWEILYNLKSLDGDTLIWSNISRDIFVDTNTTPADIDGIFSEYISTITTLNIWFILYSEIEDTVGIFIAKDIDKLAQILDSYSPTIRGDKIYIKIEGTSLTALEIELIDLLSAGKK